MLELGEAQIRRTDVAPGLLLARQSGVRDIAWASAEVDKFLHFMVEGFALFERDRLLPRRSALVAGHETDQLAEHGKLELGLDAVDYTLERGLDNVQVGEFDAEKGDIHEDDQDVDGDSWYSNLRVFG